MPSFLFYFFWDQTAICENNGIFFSLLLFLHFFIFYFIENEPNIWALDGSSLQPPISKSAQRNDSFSLCHIKQLSPTEILFVVVVFFCCCCCYYFFLFLKKINSTTQRIHSMVIISTNQHFLKSTVNKL